MQQIHDPKSKIVQLMRQATPSSDEPPPTPLKTPPSRFWNTVGRWGYLVLVLPLVYLTWAAGQALDIEPSLSGRVALVLMFAIGPVAAALAMIAAARCWRLWWTELRGVSQ